MLYYRIPCERFHITRIALFHRTYNNNNNNKNKNNYFEIARDMNNSILYFIKGRFFFYFPFDLVYQLPTSKNKKKYNYLYCFHKT